MQGRLGLSRNGGLPLAIVEMPGSFCQEGHGFLQVAL